MLVNQLQQQIQQLIAQDLMLEPSFKNKVLNTLEKLNQLQLTKVLAALQKLVIQEQSIIAQTLEKKPYLFNEIQFEILQIMHNEFVKIETITQEEAETELAEHLKVLFT